MMYEHIVSVLCVVLVPLFARHYATRWADNFWAMRRIRQNIQAQQRRMYN
jgi:hypothetical protein